MTRNLVTEITPMSDLTTKLNEYQDFELAFIVKYKLDTYSDSVVKKLNEEIELRNLSKKSLENLIEEKAKNEIKEHQNKICPRCTSQKIMTTKEEFHGNNKAFGLDSGSPLTYIEVKICGVCGWNFTADESKYEKRNRITTAAVALVISILFILLLTYIINWASE
ncbi:MAG: hypothetical protein ACI9JN_002086 [Bacteroidia bacterium]|jgi:hypothetical protein